MRTSWKCKLFVILVLMATTTSCASIETINVWRDESSSHRLGKVLVLAVSEPDFMQEHFENVLSVRLSSWGIEAVTANEVFSQSGMKLERDAVLAKVRGTGIGNVLVARAVSKEEASGLYRGGVYRNPSGRYAGWYGFYSRLSSPALLMTRNSLPWSQISMR